MKCAHRTSRQDHLPEAPWPGLLVLVLYCTVIHQDIIRHYSARQSNPLLYEYCSFVLYVQYSHEYRTVQYVSQMSLLEGHVQCALCAL